jgi:hypothetical protein
VPEQHTRGPLPFALAALKLAEARHLARHGALEEASSCVGHAFALLPPGLLPTAPLAREISAMS